jgi:adenosine deaminase/aminodeoxyfutalosine deaminase
MTGCCLHLEDHPLRRYFDAGLMVTVNSDDPALFHSNLAQEYEGAQEHFGFTGEHLRELAANSIEASFLPPERKVTILRGIESLQ